MRATIKAMKEEDAQTEQRPWGGYTTLAQGRGYKIKRITVDQGQSLSLQYHHHRSEHWVVASGCAMVELGEEREVAHPGEYRFIPARATHRLSNMGDEQLVLIEIQCGDYLGEDDIVRLADTYGRI